MISFVVLWGQQFNVKINTKKKISKTKHRNKLNLFIWLLNVYLDSMYYLTFNILNKIINAPCGTLKLLLALGVAKYIKSYKIHFVVQYATDYCPLEHDNYKTISAHLGSPISCYINNLHGAFIFLLSVYIIFYSPQFTFSKMTL